MSDIPKPINRYEQYLNSIATGDTSNLPKPITREEIYLNAIANNGGGGGGGGGTSDYEKLTNLPTVNNIELKGNRDLAPLVNGKVPAANLPSYVDDVIEGYLYEGRFYEDNQHTTEITGETGKIYVDLTASASYRWSGSVFVRVDDVDITGKADKVQNATNGHLAGLDGSGNLTDSGVAASSVVTDVSGKADKVSSPTVGDFAGLDSNGNLTDSGKKASDFTGKSFTGTSQEWAALSAAQKAEYTGLVNITDDTANAMLVDSTPTENSNNLVKSGGVYTAVDGCVHKTGSETINGMKIFNGDFYAQGARVGFYQGGLFDMLAAHTPNNADVGKLLAFDVTPDSGSVMNNVFVNVTGLNMTNYTYKGGYLYIGKLTTGVGNVSMLDDLSNYTMLLNTETKEVTFAGVVNANGSDYAEKFETIEECPAGRFVTLDGEKIRLAQPGDDYILGVVSENPAIIGDKDNPGTPVGLVGKLWVESDGSCKVNGFAVSGANGIATDGGSTGYRVMAVDGNRCKILVK